MKAVMQTLLISLLASLSLMGCGQKGDLFLPASKAPVATPAESDADALSAQDAATQPTSQQPAAAATTAPQQVQPSPSNTKR